MKFTTLATLLTLGAASMAMADSPGTATPNAGPTTRQSTVTAPATRPSSFLQERLSRIQMWRSARALLGALPVGVRPATPEEWNEMMAFMQDNSPVRYQVLSELNLGPNARVRLDAINKWRNYVFTRDHFPELADLMATRFRVEDDLFSLTLTAQQEGLDAAPDVRERIHDKVKEEVQIEFAERQKRIEKLEALLDQEKSKLASDQQSEDALVDQRTNGIMNRLARLNRSVASTTTRPSNQETDGPNATPNPSRDAMINVSNGQGPDNSSNGK
jgi:Skp family chaperone for outer membrane proteins